MLTTGQIWSIYFAIVVSAAIALSWLTQEIYEADRAQQQDRLETELARREAELQERVNSALYRMDWWATPLIAQQSALPHYWFRSLDTRTEESSSSRARSSIGQTPAGVDPVLYLASRSPFVQLHFQITSDNRATCPLVPEGERSEANAVFSQDEFEANQKLFAKALDFCGYRELWSSCAVAAPNDSKSAAGITFQTMYRDPEISLLWANNSELVQLEGQATKDPQGENNPKLMLQKNRSITRGSQEFAQRATNAEQFSQNWSSEIPVEPPNQSYLRLSVMRPLWIKDELVLARRVEARDFQAVQCCWLDWQKIRDQLREEIKDVLPFVEFDPVVANESLDFGHVMATLPIKLRVDSERMLPLLTLPGSLEVQGRGALMSSLWLAWGGIGVAALASAILLHGVVQLSERRGAFVSAVTHELRTPLTTFRLYSEMLAEKMVPEEKQSDYARTLKQEADRLSNLVENVLQFACLERNHLKGAVQRGTVGTFMSSLRERLDGRCQEAAMQLVWEYENVCDVEFSTELAKIEQILFNLVDNACKYAGACSDRRIILKSAIANRMWILSVRDFGPGIPDRFQRRLFQPFSKSDLGSANTAAGVGLGLALCRKMVQSLSGRIYLERCQPGVRFVVEVPIQLMPGQKC